MEYEEDELADNLDDEKHLFRVEQRAGRKSKQKGAKDNRKKGRPSKKPFRGSWFSSAQSSGEHAAHGGGTAAVVAAPGLPLLVLQVLELDSLCAYCFFTVGSMFSVWQDGPL